MQVHLFCFIETNISGYNEFQQYDKQIQVYYIVNSECLDSYFPAGIKGSCQDAVNILSWCFINTYNLICNHTVP